MAVVRRAGRRWRPSHPPRRPTRPTASPRRAGGGSLRAAGEGGDARATRHRRRSRPARQVGHFAPELRPSTGWRHPMTILDGHGAFEPLGRVVLQLLDACSADLTHPEVFFDAPAPDVPVAGCAWRRRRCSPATSVSRNHSSGSAAGGVVVPRRTWTTHSATGSSPGQMSAAPAGSAASRRRPAPRGGPCGPVCWPSRARSAAAPRPWRRLGPARCAPYRTDGVIDRLPDRASFPCRGRGRPWLRTSQVDLRLQPRGARLNRSRKSASRSITHTTRVWDNCSAACAQSRSPSIGTTCAPRAASGAARPSASGFGGAGASKAACRSTPNATPSGLTAKVVCNSRHARHRPGLVRADGPQVLASARAGLKFRTGAVLDAQHRSSCA